MASNITLTPPPGGYSNNQTVTVTGNANYEVVATYNGPDPAFVRTVASSNTPGTEYPYIQVIEDGFGRVLLDGAFSKFYNSRYNTSSGDFSKYWVENLCDYLTTTPSPTGNVLILGDRMVNDGDLAPNVYAVKSTTTSGFYTALMDLFPAAGVTPTIKDRGDYPNQIIDLTLNDLLPYDFMMFMSSREQPETAPSMLTKRAKEAIAAYRKAGGGIYLCTDHGRNNTLYYFEANNILSYITAGRFFGLYDFSPGRTVAENEALWGAHPLFKDMAPETIVTASTSDSYVIQELPDPKQLPFTFNVTDGPTTVKFAIRNKTTGEITVENYSYYVNFEPGVTLVDIDGNPLSALPTNSSRKRYVGFKYTKPIDPEFPVTGFVRAGGRPIGSFTVDPTTLEFHIDWTDSAFVIPSPSIQGREVTMPFWNNLPIVLQFTSPMNYEISWPFNRVLDAATSGQKLPTFMKAVRTEVPTAERHLTFGAEHKALVAVGAGNKYALSTPDNVRNLATRLRTIARLGEET